MTTSNIGKKKERKVICLHCYEEGYREFGEKHKCMWELLDYLAQGIVECKEFECGNSGLNWNDYYEHRKKELLSLPTKSSKTKKR